jgi:hypothetical protein
VCRITGIYETGDAEDSGAVLELRYPGLPLCVRWPHYTPKDLSLRNASLSRQTPVASLLVAARDLADNQSMAEMMQGYVGDKRAGDRHRRCRDDELAAHVGDGHT